jgi:hypothetical protein
MDTNSLYSGPEEYSILPFLDYLFDDLKNKSEDKEALYNWSTGESTFRDFHVDLTTFQLDEKKLIEVDCTEIEDGPSEQSTSLNQEENTPQTNNDIEELDFYPRMPIVKHSRKFEKDSFQKKIKTHLLKFVIKFINEKLDLINRKLKLRPKEKLKLKNLPNKNFNADIDTERNKLLTNKTLMQIFSTMWDPKSEYVEQVDLLNFERNSKVIQQLKFAIDEELTSDLMNFMNLTYKKVYEIYLKKQFIKDCEKIRMKMESTFYDNQIYMDEYMRILDLYAKYFILTFLNSSGNKKSL